MAQGSVEIGEIVAKEMPPWITPRPSRPRSGVVAFRVRLNKRGVVQIEFLLVSGKSGPLSFPKGEIEGKDLTAKMAAMREFEEEVGIVLKRKLGDTPWIHFVDRDGEVRSVLFFAEVSIDTPCKKPESTEVDRVEWFTFQQLHDMLKVDGALNSGVRHVIEGLGIICRYDKATTRSRHAVYRPPHSWEVKLRTTLEELSAAKV